MEVRALQKFQYENDVLKKGEVYELPDSVAKSAVDKGYAEKVEEKKAPKLEAPGKAGESEQPSETESPGSEGISVEDYVKSGGWITADDVSEGDVLEIAGPGRMDDRFEQEYLVVPVRFSGAEYDLRLGKRNTKRIADGYGNNTGRWVGKKIKVVSIEDYPGLGKKGLILKPAE